MTAPANYADLDFVPQPFELPDEVLLPNGGRLAGTRARVYGLLRKTADERIAHRIGRQVGPAGWVPSFYFRKPWCGGNAGDRRLRDLREFGVALEDLRYASPDGEISSTWLWRWVSDPEASSPATDDAPGAPRTADPNFPATHARAGERSPDASQRGAQPGAMEFYTSVGFPGGHAPGRIEVTPGARHALAPPAQLGARVIHGNLTQRGAADLYLTELRKRWKRHELQPAIRPGVWTIWSAPESPFDPLPALVEVLTKIGAEHLGEWNAREREGVA